MHTVKSIYVLDACALLRLAQDEPGADQVEEILRWMLHSFDFD